MANRYPYPHPQVRPVMAPPNQAGFPSVNMWQQQPASQTVNRPQHLQFAEEQRQREYLKQQQKLRLMAATSNKQPVNADKLIENLLGTKDIFRPRTSNQQASHSPAMPQIQVPIHQGTPAASLLVAGGVKPLHYSQVYAGVSTLHSATSVPSGSEVGGGLQNRTPQECSGVTFQLPVWLSSQSPSLPTLYRQVWTLVGLDRGLVDTSKIFPLLLTSGLPTDVLGYIWGLANQKFAGQLTEDELYIVLALVGLAQSGCTFNNLSILNLIPQAPIPSLNFGSFQPSVPRTEMTTTVPGKFPMEDQNFQITSQGESSSSSSQNPSIPAEVIDDFSDFQSAVCSEEPTCQHKPESIPDPLPSHDSPIHKDITASTPSVAFQGISSSFDGHKLQSIFSLGSSSRSVGSRLANHSLGAPKQSKNRHHKHHHHHHHHHHHQRANPQAVHQPTPSNSQESTVQVEHQVSMAVSPDEDDFSDFQQAKDLAPLQTPPAHERFSKCSVSTPPSHPHILKESAIRSDKPESNVFFNSPVHLKINLNSSEKEPCVAVNTLLSVESSDSDSKTITQPIQHPVPTTTQELLSVEEDKYSALRALSMADQEPTESKEVVSDDFGDFLSADPVSTEDSFAALATREVSSKVVEANSFWPSSNVGSQSVEFQVDDWGTFESSTSEVKTSFSTNTNEFLNSLSTEPSVSGLASALEGLDLKNSGVDFSWDSLNKDGSKHNGKDHVTLEANAVSPSLSATPSDNWMDPSDEFSQTQSAYKGYGLSFLGKIYNDHNQVISNTKNDLFVLESAQHADSGSFVIKTEDDDEDEFGEFIGPETWPDDTKFTAKENIYEGQAVLRVKDATCDTQSVSSLELPVLSRHGSLPSLDLKIFPSGPDKIGLLQSWDCSPQGIDLQIKEWCRCLLSCLQLLQAALATFTSISSESVMEEVVTSHEGKEYLSNLLEVYGICRRVKQSASSIAADSKLDSILAEVDIVWTGMEQYFNKAELKVVDVDFGCNAADSTQEQSSCGICLTSVGSDIIQDHHNNIYPLEYGGQVYHAACANLWVNCVDCRLPALASTGSLL